MSRYSELFKKLQANNEGAFVPFMTIGDPSMENSFDVLCSLVEGGADALELGIPFSDPGADGPTIQMSDKRALDAGANTENCFAIIKQVREKYPEIPIGLLMYVNLVFAPGLDNFFKFCEESGVDSVLIPDVPIQMIEKMPEWKETANKHNVELVLIAPPNASDEILKKIANNCQGYIYLLSRAGVTGTEKKAGMPLSHTVKFLKENGAPPALLGFGISTPEQVKEAIMDGADGAISGSALVKIVEKNLGNINATCSELKQFVASMKAATHK
ncbi:MAG: tryptophan synthase subunit alpha [Succinivibrionaceae bacterium]